MTHFKITAIALAAALPGFAVAQTAATPPATAPSTMTEPAAPATTMPATTMPADTTAAPAATTTAPAATTTPMMPATSASELPPYVNLINDDSITSRLEEAGYTDVAISRSGSTLTIDATRDGKPTNLVYDLNTGALQTVDGAGYEVPNATTPAAGSSETNSMGQTDQPGGEAGTDGSSGGDDGDDSTTPSN